MPTFGKELPDSVNAVEGKPLNLVAKIEGEPLPAVQWTKDGKLIKPSEGVRIEEKPDGTVSLSIESAKPKDSGQYAIIAKTPSGDLKSFSDVNVLKKGDEKIPAFGKELPDSIDAVEGKPLNLVAKIEGEPFPEVKWTKDGKPIKPSDGVKIETKPDGTVSLSIDCAKPQDAGKYVLSIETPEGLMSSTSGVKISKAREY
jgi:hypothetical protein